MSKQIADLHGCPTETPWGHADHIHQLAPGIWQARTPRHGGYWLSPDRLKELHPAWKGFVGYSGSYQWFEEDCDWSVVALCFPDHFSDYFIYSAFKAAVTMDYARQRLQDFLMSGDGRVLLQSSIKYEQDNGQLFEIGSTACMGKGKPWECSAYRIDGQERLTWEQTDYPVYVHPFHRSHVAKFQPKSEARPAPKETLQSLVPAEKVRTQ